MNRYLHTDLHNTLIDDHILRHLDQYYDQQNPSDLKSIKNINSVALLQSFE